jgi:endonuclease G
MDGVVLQTCRWMRIVLFGLVVAAQVTNCHAQLYEHLRLGNPSDAREDPRDRNNFLMRKKFFAVSYNDSLGTPNWVSWHLTSRFLGDAPRTAFHGDNSLPVGFTEIQPADYTGSGFDRGHLCPHSDRAASEEMSNATFVMTNMVPQSPENNEKAWDQLERYLRSLVLHQGKQIYIVAGPYGKGGVGRNGEKSLIRHAGHKIVVPAVTWKVALVLNANADLSRPLDNSARLIGVIVPNDSSPGHDWSQYRVPVAQIEKMTGYQFFDRLNSRVLEAMKTTADEERIPPPVIVHRSSELSESESQ